MDELLVEVTDLNTVQEQYRGLYTEKDGKHVLNITIQGYKPPTEFNKVTEALRKERNDHGQTRAKLQPFQALGNLDDVQAQLARIPELEIAAEGKIDDKKIEKLVEQRITGKLAPVQRQLTDVTNQLGEANKTIETYRTKEKTRTIHDAVRGAATKSKLRGEALEDALMLGERVFDVDESGSVVTRDNVGYTPGIDPVTWFTELQPKRPHWWGESVGGGGGGNLGGPSMTKNPFSFEHWNLTEQGNLVRTNRAQAENLAKAAGTSIGGGKPPPKQK